MTEKKVNLLVLFWKFFKIGLFTFGGGFVMIPLIEREVVRNGWINKEDVVDIVALSQSIPGAVAVNMSLFSGHRIAKAKGALVAVLGCITPSILLIILIAAFFSQLQDVPVVNDIFIGVLSAVVALILKAAVNIAKHAVMDFWTFLLSLLTVAGLIVFRSISPIFFILGGGTVGLLFYYLYPKKVREIQAREIKGEGEQDD